MMRWVGVVVAVVCVAGCGSPAVAPPVRVSDPPTPAAAPGPAGAPTPDQGLPVGVRVVPASSHVTGLPYPPHCVLQPGSGGQLPDQQCTPGSIRSDIDPGHLERNVCLKGWSGTVRPPKAETDKLKTQAMASYGVPAGERSITELDHKIPESMGGASDTSNLWPQVSNEPGHGFRNTKDDVEDQVHAWICSGHRDRWADAVVAFAVDWRTVKNKLGVP